MIFDALKIAEANLVTAEKHFPIFAASLNKGAWVGAIALCRDTVLKTQPSHQALTGDNSLLVYLTEETKMLLEMMTRRRVGQWVALRVNGRVVSTPMIYEPMTEGMLEISQEPAVLEQLRLAAVSAC